MAKVDKYPIPTTCIHCGHEVVYTSNAEIYGKEYGSERGQGRVYLCRNCKAYVGVHPGTNIPLGILATQRLRNLKKLAHSYFDPIWKSKKKYRWQCYQELSKKLGIPHKECHFGWFDEPMLMRAIDILKKGLFDEQSKLTSNKPEYINYTGKSFKCTSSKYGCYTLDKIYPISARAEYLDGRPTDFIIVDDDGDNMTISFCLKSGNFELID